MEILGVTKIIVNYLRDRIISGEFKPGEKLNEQKISNILNVSRSPIREAFRLLENEQMIISVPRKGTYVSKATKENVESIFQAREMIECFAIDILQGKNIKDIPQVLEAIDNPLKLNLENKIEYLMGFVQFHVKLVEASGNHLLIHFYRAISSNLARYQFMYAWLPGQFEHSQVDHKKFMLI